MTTPVIPQLAVARFLESGAMERHLRGLRLSLETQVTQIAECVLRNFSSGTAISRPEGGFFLWVQLSEGVDALKLHRLAGESGVHIVPGQVFSPHADITNRIRCAPSKGCAILLGESPSHIKNNPTVCIESCDEVS